MEERRRQVFAKEEAERQARFDALKREEEEAEERTAAIQSKEHKPEEASADQTFATPPPAPEPVASSSTASSNNPFAKLQQANPSEEPPRSIPGSSQAEKPNEATNKRISYNPFAAFSAFSATKAGAKDDSDSEDEGWDTKQGDSDSDNDESDFPAAGSAKNLAGKLFSAMTKPQGSPSLDTVLENSPKPDTNDAFDSAFGNEIPPPPPAPPAAPAAPAAPPAPPAPAAPAATIPPPSTGGDSRSALLNQIQLGTSLKKAVTNDRSSSSVSGRVIGGDSTSATPSFTVSNTSSLPEISAPAPVAAPLSGGGFLSELQARTTSGTSPLASNASLPDHEKEPQPPVTEELGPEKGITKK
jgi:hypothetical protein